MININEWRLIKESLNGSVNLGLARPNVIGGPIGSRLHQEDFDEEDEDFEDEDDEYDGEQTGGDEEDDDELEGDLFGSSEDEGPEKAFPPDDSQDVDGLPTPDEEMLGNDDEFGGDEFGDDLAASMGAGPGGEEGDPSFGDDMSFLNDIDPEMAGFGPEEDEFAGDAAFGGGAGDEFGGEAGMGAELPCPDCNPDGMEQMGDEACQTCAGQGFVPGDDLAMGDEFSPDDLGGIGGMGGDDEFGGDAGFGDDVEGDFGDDDEFGGDAGFGDDVEGDFGGDDEFGGEEGFGDEEEGEFGSDDEFGDDEEEEDEDFASMRSYMRKDDKKPDYCGCESSDPFLASLAKGAQGDHRKKNKSGLSEDALLRAIDPNYDPEEDKPGRVGFAPQGRLNQIGGGYTKDDFKDLPVLGESHRFPTLSQYVARKAKRARRR